MNKQQTIEDLKKVLKATKVSDFSGAYADSAEGDVEDEARQVLQVAIDLFELADSLSESNHKHFVEAVNQRLIAELTNLPSSMYGGHDYCVAQDTIDDRIEELNKLVGDQNEPAH